MQINCPQCGKLLEAPYPLPAMAKCPFCDAVFKPMVPAPPPPTLPPALSLPPETYAAPSPIAAAQATDRLRAPSIALMVMSALYIVGALVDLIVRILIVTGRIQFPPALARFVGPADVTVGMGSDAIALVFGVIMMVGAERMLRLRSYGLAVTASILSMVPCSICCCMTLPFGIWALVVLSQPEVRSGFQ